MRTGASPHFSRCTSGFPRAPTDPRRAPGDAACGLAKRILDPPRPPGPWLPGRRRADQMGGPRDLTARVWHPLFRPGRLRCNHTDPPPVQLAGNFVLEEGVGDLGGLGPCGCSLNGTCAENISGQILATKKLPGSEQRLALTISSRSATNGSMQCGPQPHLPPHHHTQ